MPYSFHEFLEFNESIAVPYYFRHDAFTQESKGPEIYCLRKDAYDKIQEKEYEFETRILESFQYFPGLYANFLSIGPSDEQHNREQNAQRTEKVEEKEEKRVTPMKPCW